MSFLIKTLTKTEIAKYLIDLVILDNSIREEIGLRYGNVIWDEFNFLKDIKGKWEFSQIAISKLDEKLSGFIIASEMLPNEIHIHRFAVRHNSRRIGVGSLLVNKLLEIAIEHRIKRITVEVSRLNTDAISFYQRFNFVCLSQEELISYASKRKQGIQLIKNFTREPDGCEFYILQRGIEVV